MAVNNLNTPGTGIQPTLVDAKGDLIAGVANDAVNRLAVGTNGQQLVADSTASTGLKWDNPSGLIHIKTESFSATSALSINNVFTSEYDNYRLLLNYATTGNIAIRYRMRIAGSDNTDANYEFTELYLDPTVSGSRLTNETSGRLFVGTTTSNVLSLDIFRPFNTGATIINTQYGLGFYAGFVSNRQNQSLSFDGMTIFPASSTISGNYFVYGYRK